MKNPRRIPTRSTLRAGLLATLVTIAPTTVDAQSPKRPVRLPTVTNTVKNSPALSETSNAHHENSSTNVRSTNVQSTHVPPAQRPTGDWMIPTSQVRARLAAMKDKSVTIKEHGPSAAPQRWLRTTTADARLDVARNHLAKATRAYEVGAWLSAEASSWEALHAAAEAIDLAQRESGIENEVSETATARLRAARLAIREARDFARWSLPADSDAIYRTARSHVTSVLHEPSNSGITANDASDRYLDAARIALSTLAAQSIEAAQAMDLLAATFLTRNEPKQLPKSTALCLRRAALQGQPQNASLAFRLGSQLAAIGLWDEAQWALRHSLSLQPNQEAAYLLASVLRRSGQGDAAEHLLASYRHPPTADGTTSTPKIPQITQLSPEQFAAVSPPVMTASAQPIGTPAQVVSVRTQPANPPASSAVETADDDQPGMIRSFFGSLRRVW